ncbi:MAG: ribosomal L7Ae/L30e/S12e/Gadd45 family protein [Eubacteriales bacterium]|nr:ribosomal L7Ae/L30e/S12e/Gadd45 family protein [Eubacteriales bacterium]
MENDPVLGMLGLARRAGKLAYGDELVRDLCAEKKARCVFVAADAGASTAKKAAFYAEGANVPFIVLPSGKETLGAAIGRNGCAVCAVSDIGMAAAALQKLAAQDAAFADAAARLAEKNARIQSRRGKKKPKPEESAAPPSKQQTRQNAAARLQRKPKSGAPSAAKPRRPASGRAKPAGGAKPTTTRAKREFK